MRGGEWSVGVREVCHRCVTGVSQPLLSRGGSDGSCCGVVTGPHRSLRALGLSQDPQFPAIETSWLVVEDKQHRLAKPSPSVKSQIHWKATVDRCPHAYGKAD